jgi:hypothetical protein
LQDGLNFDSYNTKYMFEIETENDYNRQRFES